MAKRCFKCGEVLALSEFYRHAGMADGHFNKCKTCTKNYAHQRRHGSGREKVLAYDRERASQPHRIESRARIVAEWRKEHPDRRAAQVALGDAVRSGRVIPWPVCAVPECNGKPEAHHPDYGQPLQVVWLCSAHHKQVHSMANRIEAENQTTTGRTARP